MSMTAGELALLERDFEITYSHRCTIVQPSVSHSWDSEGGDVIYLSNQACYYAERVSNEVTDVGSIRLITTATLFLPRDTAITESDRVTVITDERGAALITNTRGIQGIIRLPSHMEILLQGAGA